MKRLALLPLILILIFIPFYGFNAPTQAATSSSTTLLADSYTTTRGWDGGQPVTALHVQDQSGDDDDWDNYVEFDTDSDGYRGYRTYTLPANIDPATITAIQVQVNYPGPVRFACG